MEQERLSLFLLVITFNVTKAVIIPYAPNLSLLTKESDMHKLIDGKLDCELCGQGVFSDSPTALGILLDT